MDTAVVCSGRNRPQSPKEWWEAMASNWRSQAAAMNRNSCAPVRPAGEADLVDLDDVVAQQRLNDPADVAVGHALV
jgi:hypothetical protein